MKKPRGKAFPKGNKLAKGGRRNPPGGRPTKEAVATKKAELEQKAQELEIAKDVWERAIRSREKELADKYVKRVLENDAMLRDLRRARIPNALRSSEGFGPARSIAARAASPCNGRSFGTSRMLSGYPVCYPRGVMGLTPHASVMHFLPVSAIA